MGATVAGPRSLYTPYVESWTADPRIVVRFQAVCDWCGTASHCVEYHDALRWVLEHEHDR